MNIDGIPPIEPFQLRLKEIDDLMARPDFFQDQRRAGVLSKEHQKLRTLIDVYVELERLLNDLSGHQALVNDPTADADLVLLAKEEMGDLEGRIEYLKKSVLVAMIPPDETDSRNTVVEIRAGTGGGEASIFAAELYRLYTRFAENRGWRIETMGLSESDYGGIREVAFLITGEEVYRWMKYESGVHRVQRVPTTETNGRIHTSTATVAVLREAEEVDIEIRPEDLEISVCRASGPGGQGVNTTDSAVQMHHKPSGLTVFCADERSQQKNKAKALKVLRSRLLKAQQEAESAKYAAHRRGQIGTGDRSERIRTYNFPQNRLTDHRINVTLYNLPQVMEGAIDELVESLRAADEAEKIQLLLEGSYT